MVCIPWQLVFDKAAHRFLSLPAGFLPAPLWLLQFFGVIPAAMIIHHLVERPAREAMRRHGVPFFHRPTRPGARIAVPAAAGS